MRHKNRGIDAPAIIVPEISCSNMAQKPQKINEEEKKLDKVCSRGYICHADGGY
jgi:hypothetical protein